MKVSFYGIENAEPQSSSVRDEFEQPQDFFSFPDKEILNDEKEKDLISFNKIAENEFCEVICFLLEKYPRLTVQKAVAETAFRLDVSPVTAKRYLTKHTTDDAQFAVVEKFIVCKAHRHHAIKVLKGNHSF